MTRLALLTATALLSTPAFAASEGEINSRAVALCRTAVVAKEPTAAVTFLRGDFKARAARLEFAVRGADGARRKANCRVSNKDATITDLTIG